MTLFLLIALPIAAASLFALISAVRNAPEGLETADGFIAAPAARRATRRRRASLVHGRQALSH
ncbi:MAG TPA: hypothetical protein VGL42_06320 [Opitutaceae bacterium]|jgi:hypothetical protein